MPDTHGGNIETCLTLTTKTYPITMIYLNLMGAMDAMNLRKEDIAKKYFMDAWLMAKPDSLIEGIGEHHGLLQGLIETCIRNDYPEDYQKIIQITYQFSYGWRRIHNPATDENIADNLTTMEFTIAMLANRGWTNTEIASHLNRIHVPIHNNPISAFQLAVRSDSFLVTVFFRVVNVAKSELLLQQRHSLQLSDYLLFFKNLI